MAWHYAPDTADSTSVSTWLSEASYEPCATLNGKQEPRKRSWRGWKTRLWSERLFGTTSEPSTVARGVAEWISSLPVTPANRLATRGSGSEPTTPAICGPKSGGSSERQLLLWPSSRTSEDTSGTDSRKSSLTSMPTGSMRSGVFSARETLVLRTNETASGSLRSGKVWPTPAARDYRSPNATPTGKGSKHLDQLPNYVRHLWLGTRPGHLHQTTRTDGTAPKPQLNPLFVEWLMGLPKGWTTVSASGCLETEWSRWQQRMHSELLRLVQDYASDDQD